MTSAPENRPRAGPPSAEAAHAREAGPGPWGWVRRFAPLLLLAAATIAAFAFGLPDYLRLDTLVAYRDKLQAFVVESEVRAVLCVATAYVVVVALSIPGSVFLTLLSGFLFGWLLGGTVAVISATAGAVLLFGIARTSVGDFLLRRAGERVRRLARGFQRSAFSYLLFLRMLPVVPFWLVNLAAALLGVPLRTFALATLIGIVPITFTFATAGAGLDQAIVAQQEEKRVCLAAGRPDCSDKLELEELLTPPILIALSVLATLSLAPVLVRRRVAGLFGGAEGDDRRA